MGALAEPPALRVSLPLLRGQQTPEPTAQQLRVIKLIAEGKSGKEIAVALGIETSTADTHRTNLYRRMGFRSVVDVVHYALAHGVICNRYQGTEFFGT